MIDVLAVKCHLGFETYVKNFELSGKSLNLMDVIFCLYPLHILDTNLAKYSIIFLKDPTKSNGIA